MVPLVVLPPFFPPAYQYTAVLVSPVTFAENWTVAPGAAVTYPFGVIVTLWPNAAVKQRSAVVTVIIRRSVFPKFEMRVDPALRPGGCADPLRLPSMDMILFNIFSFPQRRNGPKRDRSH